MGQRLYGIDALRGLAALAVAAYHLCGRSESPSAALISLRTVTEWGYLGVPVFFVISGFVISRDLRDAVITRRFAATYALRRESRLAPPYWAAILFATLISVPLAAVAGKPAEWPALGNLAAHAVYAQNWLDLPNLTVGLWTLCLEVQFYVSLLVLIAVGQRLGLSLAAMVLPLGGLSLLCSLTADGDAGGLVLNAYRSLLPNFSLFVCGISAMLVTTDRISVRTWALWQAAVAVRLVVWFQPELLAAFLTGTLIVADARWRPVLPTAPALVKLGAISYSLYLLHVPAARLFFTGSVVLTGVRTVDTVLGTLAALGVVIVAAWGMWHAVERPSLRLSKYVKERHHRTGATSNSTPPGPSSDVAPTVTLPVVRPMLINRI
jgi:peptidoglycan/LPS O-acetylase OafA/YrhL